MKKSTNDRGDSAGEYLMTCPREYDHYFFKYVTVGFMDSLVLAAAMALLLFLPIFSIDSEIFKDNFSLYEEAKAVFQLMNGDEDISLSASAITGFVLAAIVGLTGIFGLMQMLAVSFKYFDPDIRDGYYTAVIEAKGGKPRGYMKFLSNSSFCTIVPIYLLTILIVVLIHNIEKSDLELILTKRVSSFVFIKGANFFTILPVFVFAESAALFIKRRNLFQDMKKVMISDYTGEDDYESTEDYEEIEDFYDAEDFDDYEEDEY